MSSAVPSHLVVVTVGTAALTGNKVCDGLDSVSVGGGPNLLETTAFKDGAFITRIAGLHDADVDVSGHWVAEADQTTGQAWMRALCLAGTSFYINIMYYGTSATASATTGSACEGYQLAVLATPFKVDSKVGATNQYSHALKLNSQGGTGLTRITTAPAFT